MNLVLAQNSVNYIYPTLSELVTISDPVYFLFLFKSQTTGQEIVFTTPNISTALTRYDMFKITLTGSSYENLTDGVINMDPTGKWTYKAYQAQGVIDGDMAVSINNAIGEPLELGYIQLSGTSLNTIQNYYSGQTDNYNYYTGQID